jgi:hypothetical protein
MAYKISITRRDEIMDTLSPNMDGGYIKIFTGSRPAAPEDMATGTLLATLTFATPAFAASSSGSIVANPITRENSAPNSGTAGWFRIYESDGMTSVMDGTITALSGGGEIEMVILSVVAGQPVEISSFSITLPL